MEPKSELATPRPTLLYLAARHKLGLIALSTDLTAERNFARLMPLDDIGVFATRISIANPTTPDNLRAMAPGLAANTDRILQGLALDAICYCCTASSVVIGDAQAAAAPRIRPRVPVVTQGGAAVGWRTRRDRNRHRETGVILQQGQRLGAAAPRPAEPQATRFRPPVQPRPCATNRNLTS